MPGLLGIYWMTFLRKNHDFHFPRKVPRVTRPYHLSQILGFSKKFALLPADHLDSLDQTSSTSFIPTTEVQDPIVTSLLNKYQILFSHPTCLPPSRLIDHCIPLFPNTNPVSVHPYRYAHYQKEELDTQVNEMLTQGIICPSHSPYSSPVLLVRKKERTWRF